MATRKNSSRGARKDSSRDAAAGPSGNGQPHTPDAAPPTTPDSAKSSPRLLEQASPPDSERREGVFRPLNPEFLSAVRTPPEDTMSSQPGGLSSKHNTCYRNAVVIMLLSTQPIMSFVQHYHRKKLLLLENQNKDILYVNGSTVPAVEYSNILLELEKLYSSLWELPSKEKTDQLRKEMNRFSEKLGEDEMFQFQFPLDEQADARQFLEYLINLCASQLEETTTFSQDAQDWKDLFALRQTDRKRCRGCWRKNHVKHRTAHIQTNTSWTLVMKRFDQVGQEIEKDSFTLDELLRQWRKTPGESWYCDDCVAEFEMAFEAEHGHLDKNSDVYKAIKWERDTSNEDWKWYSYVSIPEVLFIDIVRFQGIQYEQGKPVHPPKDQRVVEIPEYVDIAPALDKDVPAEARHLTKYRLRAVILHAGSVTRFGTSSGHYTNYIRSADDEWWYVNDHQEVKRISFEDINKPRGKAKWGNNFTPCVMCYERVIEDVTPTPQGRKQSTDPSFDVTPVSEPSPIKKSGSPEGKIPGPALSEEPAKGIQTVAVATSTTSQGTQTEGLAPISQPPATASQATQTVATSTRSQGTQTISAATPSQPVLVDASTQTEPTSLPSPPQPLPSPPQPLPSPPQPQALLHLSLTLGSTTYNLTPTIADLSPSLLEEIARGAKPAARWMATLELPPVQEASSKDGAKASKKGGRGAQAGVSKRRAGAAAAPSRRLIELDPALGRTYFLASDVTATMRRSARVAGRKQAAIKKKQEEEAGGKGKHKRCDPFCDEHCPEEEEEEKKKKGGTKGEETRGAATSNIKEGGGEKKKRKKKTEEEEETGGAATSNIKEGGGEKKKRKKKTEEEEEEEERPERPAKRQKTAKKPTAKKAAVVPAPAPATTKTAKRNKVAKTTDTKATTATTATAKVSTKPEAAVSSTKRAGGDNATSRPPVPQRRPAQKKTSEKVSKKTSEKLSKKMPKKKNNNNTTTAAKKRKPSPPPVSLSSSSSSSSSSSASAPPPATNLSSTSSLSPSQVITTPPPPHLLSSSSSSSSSSPAIKKESPSPTALATALATTTTAATATLATKAKTPLPPPHPASPRSRQSRSGSPSPLRTPSNQIKRELGAGAGTSDGDDDDDSDGHGLPPLGTGGSADGGVSPRTRRPAAAASAFLTPDLSDSS